MRGKIVDFQNKTYRITKLLGKGKSAYSWLCEHGDEKMVLKQIHDEPCSYYEFTDKLKSEVEAYHQLKNLNIAIPEMLGIDPEKRWIFKEYIDSNTAAQIIADGKISHRHFKQLFNLAGISKEAGFNPDFFPTNFIVNCGNLYYIDYELNPYDERWNLHNWGIYYWVNQEGMKKFMQTGDAKFINADTERGIPVKEGLQEVAEAMIARYYKSEPTQV